MIWHLEEISKRIRDGWYISLICDKIDIMIFFNFYKEMDIFDIFIQFLAFFRDTASTSSLERLFSSYG